MYFFSVAGQHRFSFGAGESSREGSSKLRLGVLKPVVLTATGDRGRTAVCAIRLGLLMSGAIGRDVP